MEQFTTGETVHYSILGKHAEAVVAEVSKTGHKVTVNVGPSRDPLVFTRRAHGQHVQVGTNFAFLHHGPAVNGY